ncbi:unnamed protein product [Coregonus sp. 'balchen']|nr:unnamed protein product [Coregonus sp. 'balchen']
MASLLQPDRVLYLVHGEKKIRSPLSTLYFCRYCSELRSLECVSHEVGLALLSKLPGEYAFSRGKAEEEQLYLLPLRAPGVPTASTAPCCMPPLSTRATNIPAPLPDDPSKTTMKKAYYLACGFCRWTSRDVGMADKSPVEDGRSLRTLILNGSIKLIEYYQQLAQREKLDRDRKKLARRRPYMPLAFSFAEHIILGANMSSSGDKESIIAIRRDIALWLLRDTDYEFEL